MEWYQIVDKARSLIDEIDAKLNAEKKQTQEAIDEQMAKQERHAKKRACMLWLIERMKKRAAGRERIKAAERKKKERALKRAGIKDKAVLSNRRPVGTTEIEGDKPFYYQNGVLWKDGLGNKTLEVIGRIKQQEDSKRHWWFW